MLVFKVSADESNAGPATQLFYTEWFDQHPEYLGDTDQIPSDASSS